MATIAVVSIAAGTALTALGSYATYRLVTYLKKKKSSATPQGNAKENEALLAEAQEHERPVFDSLSSSEYEDDFVLVSLPAADERKMVIVKSAEKGKSSRRGRAVESDSDIPPRVPPKPSSPRAPHDSTTTISIAETFAASSLAPAPAPPPDAVVQPATPTSTSGGRVKNHTQALDSAPFAVGSPSSGGKTPQQQRPPPAVPPKPKSASKRTPTAMAIKDAGATPSQATPPSWMKASPNAVRVVPLGGESLALRRRRNDAIEATDGGKGGETEVYNKENRIAINGLGSPTPTNRTPNGNLETPISFDEVSQDLLKAT